VSHIPVAGLGFHSQRVALLFQFIRFYHSLIRSATSLTGTEGADPWVWDCALLVPSKTIAITRPTETICGNSKRSSVGRTIVQSHGPGDPVLRQGDGRLRPRRPGIPIPHPTEVICRNPCRTNILLAEAQAMPAAK